MMFYTRRDGEDTIVCIMHGEVKRDLEFPETTLKESIIPGKICFGYRMLW